MKIFFDFNLSRQALICHEMAKYWKKKYGIQDYAGMTAVKNGKHLDFLNNQKDIKYHFIDNRDLIEDEALKMKRIDLERIEQIEKDLNIPLWHFVVADRNMGHFFVKGAMMAKSPMMKLANHQNIMRWVIKYYDVINKRLDEYKPDAVIFLAIASLPPLMLAKICEKKGIPYFVPKSSRIRNLYSIIKNNARELNLNFTVDYEKFLYSKKSKQEISQFASDYVDKFRSKPRQPGYMKKVHHKFSKVAERNILKVIGEVFCDIFSLLISLFYFKCIGKKINYLRDKDKLSSFFIKFRQKIIVRNTQKIFNDNLNLNEKYVFFPLHFNPEASTMILAPNFVNQLMIIEALAKNIPMGYKLYVKEHIPNIGTRSKGFYDEIKKYPNVKLISPWADNFELIKNASLVTIISGTAGWEAVLMNVPVISFSETFYSEAGFATYCTNLDKLNDIIRKKIFIKTKEKDMEDRDFRLKALVMAIQKNSFKADISNLFWGEKNLFEMEDEIKKVAENFYNVFNKKE